MRELGFTGKKSENVHEWPCDKNNLHFELHDLLIKDDEKATKVLSRFFRDLMPYVKDNVLDWNYHFLFILAHLRKHYLFSGVGIRQFMDIAVLIHNGPKLNWKWIDRKADELGLGEFSHACYCLIQYWFGIEPPVPCAKPTDMDEQTEKIIKNGVFGFADADNKRNWTRNYLITRKVPWWLS